MGPQTKKPNYHKKVQEIDEVADKVCNEWECKFIGDMMDWEGQYTTKQKKIIDKLYKKVCESEY